MVADRALGELAQLPPDAVVFWSGAGISADPPTQGPLGRKLTDRALDHYFEPRLNAELGSILQSLKVENSAYRPRLETVLDALFEVYESPGLGDVLSDLEAAPPNENHHFFASHVLSGGRHVTANFDRCIEVALGESAACSDRILHLHGTLSTSHTSLEDLGARISVIQNGLPTSIIRRLLAMLGSPTVALVFVGYSGSDFFDVTPFIQTHASLLAGRTVVWHDYRPDSSPTISTPDPDEPVYLTAARQAGASTHWMRGPLHLLRDHLATTWNFQPPPHALPVNPTWTPTTRVDDPLKRSATVALAARMGLHGMVIGRLAGTASAHDPEAADRLAHAYWGAGRYRYAYHAWETAFRGNDDESRAHLAERLGATLWIRGDLLRAERSLRAALQYWTGPNTAVSISTRVLLVEAYARVLVHMRRLPDTRWLATKPKLRRSASELARLAASFDNHEGIHLRARIASASAALTGATDLTGANSQKSFDESEALHARLNYQHGALRQRADDGAGPTQEEVGLLLRAQLRIGARGDAARVLLLPGAERYFSVATFWKCWRPVDVTSYHRLRLTAGFTIRKVRSALSGTRSQ